VDSGVVRLKFLAEPRSGFRRKERFFFLVRKAFQKRRKTLLNALEDPASAKLSKEALAGVLGGLGIDSRRRPETLSLQEWALLSESVGTLS